MELQQAAVKLVRVVRLLVEGGLEVAEDLTHESRLIPELSRPLFCEELDGLEFEPGELEFEPGDLDLAVEPEVGLLLEGRLGRDELGHGTEQCRGGIDRLVRDLDRAVGHVDLDAHFESFHSRRSTLPRTLSVLLSSVVRMA